jgi:integrase
MKAVSKGIARHESGVLYFRKRVDGKIVVKSLGTRDLTEAKKILFEKGVEGILSQAAGVFRDWTNPSPQPTPSSQTPTLPCLPVSAETQAPLIPPLKEALEEHHNTMIILSKGAKETAERSIRIIKTHCSSFHDFSCIKIWNAYRDGGRGGKGGGKLTSAANHLRVHLNHFVPWAVARGYLTAVEKEELKRIPKIRVNPRVIRVPEPEQVDELIKMVETEHPVGSQFLRFLAVTGLRRGAATMLQWRDFDYAARTMAVKLKAKHGYRVVIIPMTAEAIQVVRDRQETGVKKPWDLGTKEFEVIERRLKKFAKGLELDLTYFHAFRHYFASRCLLAGMTVQEVAKLLGHSDGGVTVLKSYAHICDQHLKNAVSTLRLAA